MLNLNKTNTSERTKDSGHSESKSSRNSRIDSSSECRLNRYGVIAIIFIVCYTSLMIMLQYMHDTSHRTQQTTELKINNQ